MKKKKCLGFVLAAIFLCSINFQLMAREKLTMTARGANKRIDYSDRTLLLEFNKEVDGDTIADGIVLRDADGSLAGNYTAELYPGDKNDKTVWLKFDDDFSLKESAQYYVDGIDDVSVLLKEKNIYPDTKEKSTPLIP